MKDDPLNRTKVKRGSQLPQSKLSEDDVVLIRQMIADREDHRRKAKALTNQSIAEKFDVHRRTIDRISAGFGWGHVS